MSKQTVAIITGNSNSGSACIEELLNRYAGKVNVRGVFRSAEKAATLRAKYPGLEVVTDVDAGKPETLKFAFKNAQSAVIVTPHDPTTGFDKDAEYTANMINAAVENGVQYIVYVGSFTVNFPDVIKIISSRFLPSEKLLEKLGKEKNIKWTSLRGGFFMENLFSMQTSIKAESVIRFPNIYVPAVDTKDIGKSAAACIVGDHDKHNGKYYEMNGPEMLSAQDIADAFTRNLGRKIEWVEYTRDDVNKMPFKALVEVYLHFLDTGKHAAPFTNDAKNLTGQNGTLDQFIKDHLAEFQEKPQSHVL